MIKTIKVMLVPNNKQATKLLECSGVARFAYNWALNYERKNYQEGGKFISHYQLRKIFTQFKKDKEYIWLNNYSNNITKQAIKDACIAYKNFFNKTAQFPQFKKKRNSKLSFYVDTSKIRFTSNYIKLEKLTTSTKQNKQKFNYVKLAEQDRIPTNTKYFNPRITFDGLHWWISVGVEFECSQDIPTNNGIGIDIGVKNLAVCSDGNTYENINNTTKVKQIKKRIRRLQRNISKKYLNNKKGDNYCKTRNIIKNEKRLLKLNRKLKNIRYNYLHLVTSKIINRKPKFIVLEDLNVVGMMKNKHLSKVIQEQCFFEFYRQIEYKCRWNNIEFIVADRFYPSSKTCYRCGNIKKDLKLSDRVYHCLKCGLSIDRDLQASINLANYQAMKK